MEAEMPGQEIFPLFREDGLGDHGVNSFVAVDDLSDPQIDRQAAQRIGISSRDSPGPGDELDGIAQGDIRGFIQVGVKTHGNPVAGSFGHGPFDFHVFPDDELQDGLLHRRFNGGYIDFPISLDGMGVPGGKKGSGDMDGEV